MKKTNANKSRRAELSARALKALRQLRDGARPTRLCDHFADNGITDLYFPTAIIHAGAVIKRAGRWHWTGEINPTREFADRITDIACGIRDKTGTNHEWGKTKRQG